MEKSLDKYQKNLLTALSNKIKYCRGSLSKPELLKSMEQCEKAIGETLVEINLENQ